MRLTLVQVCALRIDDLGVSVRTANALRGQFHTPRETLGQAISAMNGRSAARSLKNFGPKCARDLREVLEHMRVPRWVLDEIVPDTWSPS